MDELVYLVKVANLVSGWNEPTGCQVKRGNWLSGQKGQTDYYYPVKETQYLK